MPWVPDDSDKHINGLTPAQKQRWATIANSVLAACLKRGGSQQNCEGQAIRIANSKARGPEKDGSDQAGTSANPGE